MSGQRRHDYSPGAEGASGIDKDLDGACYSRRRLRRWARSQSSAGMARCRLRWCPLMTRPLRNERSSMPRWRCGIVTSDCFARAADCAQRNAGENPGGPANRVAVAGANPGRRALREGRSSAAQAASGIVVAIIELTATLVLIDINFSL